MGKRLANGAVTETLVIHRQGLSAGSPGDQVVCRADLCLVGGKPHPSFWI